MTKDKEHKVGEYIPMPEPVAFASHGIVNWIADKQFQHEALLYSAPQRTWIGLTKTMVGNYLRRHALGDQPTFRQGFKEGVAFAEAKLKEKNT